MLLALTRNAPIFSSFEMKLGEVRKSFAASTRVSSAEKIGLSELFVVRRIGQYTSDKSFQ